MEDFMKSKYTKRQLNEMTIDQLMDLAESLDMKVSEYGIKSRIELVHLLSGANDWGDE
jgi:hypothetical protein